MDANDEIQLIEARRSPRGERRCLAGEERRITTMTRLVTAFAAAAGLCSCSPSKARPVPAPKTEAFSTEQPEDFEIGLASYHFDPLEYQSALPASLRRPETACVDAPCYYLVQFSGPLSTADRATLTSEFGLRLQEYIPNHAYVEHLEPEARSALCERAPVRVCLPYQPAFKLSPGLRNPPHGLDEGRPMLLVVLFDTADPKQVSAELSTLGARVLSVTDDRTLGGKLRLKISVADLARLEPLAHIEEIRWIEKTPHLDEDS